MKRVRSAATNEKSSSHLLVVRILQKRGLFREDYEGATFRESLGVRVPPNSFTVAKASRAVA